MKERLRKVKGKNRHATRYRIFSDELECVSLLKKCDADYEPI